jgi:hypothetical protein
MRFCHTPRSTIVRMIDIDKLTTLSPDSDRVRWAPLVPTTTEAIYLTRGKLRRALVMIAMRNGPITPREALKHLSERGFEIESARPLEVVRKALKAESKGVRDLRPTLARNVDNTYTYRSNSLTPRTHKRWRMQFPTL